MKPNAAPLEINAGISFLISRRGQRSPGRAILLRRVRTVTHLFKRKHMWFHVFLVNVTIKLMTVREASLTASTEKLGHRLSETQAPQMSPALNKLWLHNSLMLWVTTWQNKNSPLGKTQICKSAMWKQPSHDFRNYRVV